MAEITEGRGFPNLYGGSTANEIATGFIRIQTRGQQELSEQLLRAARAIDPSGEAGRKALMRAVGHGLKAIGDAYKQNIGRDVTGNLRKSVKNKYVFYDAAVVGVVGPRSTGTGSASEKDGSGNHAWLIEFGTPPRRPGSQNRRTYVNVHRMINGKMKRHATSMNDEQFQRQSRGYYFLMGSINEPTRQAKFGSGYPHDFVTDPKARGGIRPMTLGPNETYGGVTAKNPMQNAIRAEAGNARSALLAALQKQIKQFTNN